jgi:hypothetical protein
MLMNMTGARKKMEENGFAVAGLRRSRIWVKDQRKPDEQAETMTRMKGSLAGYHHDDTSGHDKDDEYKSPGRLFEAKEECEDEHEAECR